jgi:hypothetical protein
MSLFRHISDNMNQLAVRIGDDGIHFLLRDCDHSHGREIRFKEFGGTHAEFAQCGIYPPSRLNPVQEGDLRRKLEDGNTSLLDDTK